VFRHGDGRAVPVRCSVSLVTGTTSEPADVAALLTDLSGQVSAGEYRVRAELARQRVLETATDAYVGMDADGIVLEWNAAAERLFGYPAREAAGTRQVADRRDRAGDRRDLAADDRDEVADARDLAGASRDDAAARWDDVADRAEAGPQADDAGAARDRTRAARLGAALDRADALQDRRAGAGERAQAVDDRRVALADRVAGAAGRLGSELDRNIALADRGSGAGERALAGGDRRVSQGDREASSDDRQLPWVDCATGAYTRAAGMMELSRVVTRCPREGQQLLLVVVQVDHVGTDAAVVGGAASGPARVGRSTAALVRAASAALRSGLRSYDLVLRYEDSTFVCALTMLDLVAASARLARVSESLAGGDPRGSLTFGAAALVPDDSVETVMARAHADLQDKHRRMG